VSGKALSEGSACRTLAKLPYFFISIVHHIGAYFDAAATSMTGQTWRPEVLVVGAGPGGAATAWALAEAGHEVLMVDRSEFPRDKTCGDGLTPMAVGTLREMGVLPEVEAAQPAHIEQVRIVSPFGLSVCVTLAEHLPSGSAYALVLPRFTFDEIMRNYAVRHGVEYAGRARIEKIYRTGDRIEMVEGITPDGPIQIRARQVVLAVGANVGLLEREGFVNRKPRMMRAARAYYRGASIPANRYDFYFDFELLPGYGWLFPTGDGRTNIGAGTLPVFWSTRRTAQSLLAGFAKRRAKEGVLAQAEQEGPVKGYPLRIDFPAQRVAGENWIMVGEATGLVNPLTGEGIDLALESGLLGATIMHENLQTGKPDHSAYQHALWQRYSPVFNGLRALRDILVNPLFMDYIVWQMSQYGYLAGRVVNISQGFELPQSIFHPLFLLQFFTPISPGLVARGISHIFSNGHRATS